MMIFTTREAMAATVLALHAAKASFTVTTVKADGSPREFCPTVPPSSALNAVKDKGKGHTFPNLTIWDGNVGGWRTVNLLAVTRVVVGNTALAVTFDDFMAICEEADRKAA